MFSLFIKDLSCFLTYVDYAVHIFPFRLSTGTALCINRDKQQVGFTKTPKQIPKRKVYSSSFHNPNRKKMVFPPKITFLHSRMWISNPAFRGRQDRFSVPFQILFQQHSIFLAQYSIFHRKSLSFLQLNRFSTICSNVLFPYFCPPPNK